MPFYSISGTDFGYVLDVTSIKKVNYVLSMPISIKDGYAFDEFTKRF